MRVTNHLCKTRTVAGAVFLLLLLLPMVHAETVFDYVKNPSPKYLYPFDGSSYAKIDTNSTAKRGFLVVHQYASSDYCLGGAMNGSTSTVIKGTTVKNIGCDTRGTVFLDIQVDNPDFGSIPFARIGDNDISPDNHLSVIPYSFNVWQAKDRGVTFNANVCSRAKAWHDTNSLKYKAGGTFFSSWCEPDAIFADYEWNYKGKKNVCNSQVKTALNSKSTYYSNPSDLSVDGFGTITSANCNTLMFPETSNAMDRVNSLHNDKPEAFNSLFYDQDMQFQSYPFYIDQVEITCYDIGGKVVAQTNDAEVKTIPLPAGNCVGCGTSLTLASFPTPTQYYPWSTIPGPSGLQRLPTMESTINTGGRDTPVIKEEKLSRNVRLSCPASTRYYTTAVSLRKSQVYRHKTPVDATWRWNNVFNVSTQSRYLSNLGIAGREEYILFLNYGTFALGNSTANVPLAPSTGSAPSDSPNVINQTTFNTTSGVTNKSSGCNTCKANIVVNNGTSNITLAATNGGGSGGIKNGIDDSAVSGLITQSVGDNQVAAKASFIDKLIFIGTSILTTIIALYSVFALFAIVLFFGVLFGVPNRMKRTLKELFDAGTRK